VKVTPEGVVKLLDFEAGESVTAGATSSGEKCIAYWAKTPRR